MRILIWHGWLLEGSGSNVAAARSAQALRAAGHDVVLLCQERHPERHPFVDAFGTVTLDGAPSLEPNPGASPAAGRCVVLRPEIGPVLPVFVVDRYEGFDDVRSFLDLDDAELDAYLEANVAAVRAAAERHGAQIAFVGHAVPGAAIGRRGLGAGRYVAKIHGSDLEYAVRPQERYRRLAAEGLEAARAVVGPSAEALERCAELVPGMRALGRVVPPGVEVGTFRPRARPEALRETAERLEADDARRRGRPDALDAQVASALERRDAAALDALADRYDQEAPDPASPERLRALADADVPIVGYLGKLIPQKGVELLLEAHRAMHADTHALVVGFGSHREWLQALAAALARGDADALAWLRTAGRMPGGPVQVTPRERGAAFTGRLDHRYAPGALAAMDVQVVPSVLAEAFGMVAAEGSASGALPMLARHSGLAEVAAALETEVGRPGLFSFSPGEGASAAIADGVDRLLALPRDERDELRAAIAGFVAREWTWERNAARLLDAAGVAPPA